MFKALEAVDQVGASGGGLIGEVRATFNRLVELFGEPNRETDGYKVAFEWEVHDENKNYLRIYDWKATNLYDDDGTAPTPDEFRAFYADREYDWHIGGGNVSTEAIHSLINQISGQGCEGMLSSNESSVGLGGYRGYRDKLPYPVISRAVTPSH